MNDSSKISALYSRLSVGDEDRDGGESNSIQNQKKFLESYAKQLKLKISGTTLTTMKAADFLTVPPTDLCHPFRCLRHFSGLLTDEG